MTLFCGVQLTPKLIDTLRRFPRLEWLGLRVSEADDRDLGRLRDLPALDTLTVRSCMPGSVAIGTCTVSSKVRCS